jgi:hypothetical protein
VTRAPVSNQIFAAGVMELGAAGIDGSPDKFLFSRKFHPCVVFGAKPIFTLPAQMPF